MKVPFALKFALTDAALKARIFGSHVNILNVLFEVARRTIGSLADGARQRFKAAYYSCTEGTKEKSHQPQ